MQPFGCNIYNLSTYVFNYLIYGFTIVEIRVATLVAIRNVVIITYGGQPSVSTEHHYLKGRSSNPNETKCILTQYFNQPIFSELNNNHQRTLPLQADKKEFILFVDIDPLPKGEGKALLLLFCFPKDTADLSIYENYRNG